MSDSKDYDSEIEKNNLNLRTIEGKLQHHIDMFGNVLAKKYGYREHTGIEAVRWYLVEKYHWTPATVRALNYEDLSFLMAEERARLGKSGA